MRDDKHPPWRWAGVTYQVLLARYSLPRGPGTSIRTNYVNFSSHQISHTGLDDIALACLSYLTSLESHLLIAYAHGKYDSSSKFQPHQHFLSTYTICACILAAKSRFTCWYLSYHILIATGLNQRGNLEPERGPDLVKDLS